MARYLEPLIYPRHREAMAEAKKLAADKMYGCRYTYPSQKPPYPLRFK